MKTLEEQFASLTGHFEDLTDLALEGQSTKLDITAKAELHGKLCAKLSEVNIVIQTIEQQISLAASAP